jgi:eukaryotic-like serine/threonine-protein kinase
VSTRVDEAQTAPLGRGRPRDPADEARAKRELRSRLFGPRSAETLPPDRYRLVRRIGQGGAGEVYEGWDVELGRRVAIKILHARHEEDADPSRARARLLREAQAIAQLAHPHVVSVFDVGRCTDGMAQVLGPETLDAVFVVMEYVEGETLRAWAKRRPPLRDIIAAIVAAGRGLAAAHEQGIVHRDFKPSNVAFGSDGRVRVLDFGLARAIGCSGEVTSDTDTPVLDDLTGPGVALGTPPYMAPEQHLAQHIGPAVDQYALCVSLWELATGERPFRGATSRELLAAKLEGPPPDPGLAKWLDAVLRRGLAYDPEARFESMLALVAALERGLGRRRRAVWLGAIAFAITTAAGLGAWGRDLQERRDCDDGAVATLWNDGEAAALREAFVASGRSNALATWSRTRAHLDAYAFDLEQRRAQACSVGAPGPMACLEDKLQRLRAAIAVARDDDPDLVAHALELAMELPPLASCEGAEDDRRPSDGELDRTIVRAEALLVADRLEQAEALIGDPAAIADREGDHETSARLALVAGKILERRGATRPEAIEERFRAALVAAERADRDDIALDALVQLVHVVGPVAGRFAEAGHLAAQATAKLERLGHPQEPAAALAMEIGLLRYRELRNDDALAAYDEALRLRRALFGDDHPKVARVRVEIGNVLLRKGDYADALEHFTDARTIVEHVFGPDHPSVAGALNGIALTMQGTGNIAGSIAPLEDSLAIARASAGDRHDSVAVALSNLGLAYGALEEHGDALSAFDEALSIRLELFGREHVAVARTRSNRAGILRRLGRLDEAEAEFRKALAVFETAMGRESSAVGVVVMNLGDLIAGRGDHEEAMNSYARALDIFEQHNDVDPDGLTKARLGLAQSQLATGRHALAKAGSEKVLLDGAPPDLMAFARLMLAQAIAAEDPVRARDLAFRARAWFEDRGDIAQATAIDGMIDALPDAG